MLRSRLEFQQLLDGVLGKDPPDDQENRASTSRAALDHSQQDVEPSAVWPRFVGTRKTRSVSECESVRAGERE